MQVGVTFPQTEIGADRGAVRAFAQAAEDLGYAHLIAYDHVVGADPAVHAGWAGPYTHETMFHEPFALFGYLAAVAPKLELATAVIIAPQRQTVLLAKQAAEIDILTAGRFRLGLGIGWNHVEYEALGMNFHDRGRRFEEQIELLRLLWREPVVTYEGRWHTITGAGLNPLPARPDIPLWIGANAEPAVRRAARLADGLFLMTRGLSDPGARVDQVRGWVAEAGRDPEAFGIEIRLAAGTGTSDEWLAEVEQLSALRPSHLSVNTMDGGLKGPDEHIERIRQVAEALELAPS